MLLNLEAFESLATSPRKTETVETPHGTALMKALSAGERDLWEQWYYGEIEKRRPLFRASLVAACLVDDKGVPVIEPTYDDKFVESVRTIAESPATLVDPLYAVAARLAGVAPDDEAKAGNSQAAGPSGAE